MIDAEFILKTVLACFIAVIAYFLKRTVEGLDRVDARGNDHEKRISLLEQERRK